MNPSRAVALNVRLWHIDGTTSSRKRNSGMADESEAIVPQAGAIPLRDGQVCLITSRAGRWIIPKGMIDPGMTPEQAALQEAWEEAGLRGAIRSGSVGAYRYEKWGRTFDVAVYVMAVTDVADSWPEADFRRRRWLTAADAARCIDHAELRGLFERALVGLA
jgi:8-oxo-dGTP pyrophosphatase MutT (NUDIX family)